MRRFVSETLELGELEVEGSVRVHGDPPGPREVSVWSGLSILGVD